MARVTVEDCLPRVPNPFELTLLAAERARRLRRGAPRAVDTEDWENDTVVALREIAEGAVGRDGLFDNVVERVRTGDARIPELAPPEDEGEGEGGSEAGDTASPRGLHRAGEDVKVADEPSPGRAPEDQAAAGEGTSTGPVDQTAVERLFRDIEREERHPGAAVKAPEAPAPEAFSGETPEPPETGAAPTAPAEDGGEEQESRQEPGPDEPKARPENPKGDD